MNKNIFFICLFTLTFFSCTQQNKQDGESSSESTTQETTSPNNFGETITTDNAISVNQMVTQLEGQDSVQVKVAGTVTNVCQAKGCWMNIVSNTPGADTLFVKFKDYGFFVPKDIAGRQIIMEGTAYKEMTSVDELRHYAEDEGASAEEIAAITDPVEELKFMASGVILLEN